MYFLPRIAAICATALGSVWACLHATSTYGYPDVYLHWSVNLCMLLRCVFYMQCLMLIFKIVVQLTPVQPGGPLDYDFLVRKQSFVYTKRVQPGGLLHCKLFWWVCFSLVTTSSGLLDQQLDLPWCFRKSHEDETILFVQTLLSWTLMVISDNIPDRAKYPKTGRLLRLAEATQEIVLIQSKEKAQCLRCKTYSVKCT